MWYFLYAWVTLHGGMYQQERIESGPRKTTTDSGRNRARVRDLVAQTHDQQRSTDVRA